MRCGPIIITECGEGDTSTLHHSGPPAVAQWHSEGDKKPPWARPLRAALDRKAGGHRRTLRGTSGLVRVLQPRLAADVLKERTPDKRGALFFF